ncbi:DUF916 and DUF3324 domain-containing protein [Lacticaseibacillus songhuajiangensis]|uniref:DUF916 and DUF3324 domain-containing protein n=1 Tax=Lacticaseibacillus songhuajiangensis TaxID=1296539 RepID=UPI0013DD9745|nr:DUF916 and DUF3324 domain-containing protein [Lacticaseibacillus songhuajiangensis]
MKKLVAFLMALVGLIAAAPTLTTHADQLTYSVSAQLPSNQMTNKVTYFVLKVKPDQKQNLTIAIQNKDSKSHKYRVSVNRATTNVNGVIDYSKHGTKKASSLALDIETMLPKPTTVTVPAKTSQAFSLPMTVPTKSFVGTVLGGIRVMEVDNTSAKKQQKGVSLTNRYAYVIGLQAQEQDSISGIAPNMILHSVKPTQLNYRNYISVNVENTAPIIMTKLQMDAKIYKRGTKTVVMKVNKKDMGIAPNSDFAFPVSANNKPLQAGKYTLDLNAWAVNKKYHWHFTKNFVIKRDVANKLNKSAVDQKKPKTNWLMWLLIALAILILLLLLLILLLLFKRRKKDDEDGTTAGK